jgi:TetR/AcrR family transcriptional regulator
MDKQKMDEKGFEAIVNSITTIVLKGCGVKTQKQPDADV